MQESNREADTRTCISHNQALQLKIGAIRARIRGNPCRRVEHAKTPALPVLHGRAAVWIEHVAFIEDGARDVTDCLRIHSKASRRCSAISKMCSSVSSNVGMPSRILKRYSRSNTSRRRENQAVLE